MVTDAAVGAIERAGLTARILAALDAGSLLLVADAGFGKTTALTQGLRAGGLDTAWVRCGDARGDPGRLLELVVEAVRTALPGAADTLAERLAGARERVDPELAAAALGHELASLLVDPLVIVFDDGEKLDGVPSALAVVAELLSARAPRLRVALASRRRPALSLARDRASGRLVELGPADLAFSAAECARYLRLVGRGEPDDAQVEALLASTEGWPLGIALAAGAPERDTGPSRALAAEYFEEEVLAALDAVVREAVLAASTAPDLEIAAAAGLGPADRLAVAIDRRGLFVRGAEWTGRPEFHPLFREFLRARFAGEVPVAQRQAVASRIAAALSAAGRGAEAVDYHLAAEDWDTAAATIAREGPGLVRRASNTVAGWLASLPAESAGRPELTLLAGQLAHGQGRFVEAVELCRAAVRGFDVAAAPASARYAARLALGDALMAIGDLKGVAALANVLDEPGAVGDLAARAVGVFAAAALARDGSFAAGRELLERALDDPCARALEGLEPGFLAYYVDLPEGRLDAALAHVRQAVATLEGADPSGRLPYALTYLMAIHEERGEDAEALAAGARTRAHAREAGLAGWVGEALAIRTASLRARAGDVAGAEADLAEVTSGWQAWGAWEVESTRAMIAAQRGDGRAARAAADRAVREVRARWPYFDQARCAALLAPVLAGSGHPGFAREVVETTIADRRKGFSTARLHAVDAWLLHGEGDTAAATAALVEAWRQAGDQAQHLVRREWPRIERPLWDALASGAIGVEDAIGSLAAALPGGAALDSFSEHPLPAVRRAVLLAALAAGRPGGVERATELVSDADPLLAAAARAVTERIAREPPPLAFRLLGGFELRRGTWVVDDNRWERRIAQRLVRFLLCRDGGPVLEDDLIEAFWPDKTASAARRSLQVAVSAARAVLDVPGVAESRLTSSERTYRLRLRGDDVVDAREFERAAAAALSADRSRRRSALAAAAALWGGEPLPEERYTDWAIAWRERLIDRNRQLLHALADAHADVGELAAAVDVARRLVELDPLDEAAHQRLIVAFARAGRRGHALRQFLACRRALVTSLGVEPSDETAALQRRLLAGAPV
jgi:ATP/maltotriose-dependent transcriptional regulator MalT/DNA-binding SARP family transcriptional activator